jgi:hypothetical protein
MIVSLFRFTNSTLGGCAATGGSAAATLNYWRFGADLASRSQIATGSTSADGGLMCRVVARRNAKWACEIAIR